MPKGKIKKEQINKTIFMSIIKECGSSIIKLGECEEIECTERTIRRSLNEGKITSRYLDQIAKYLDIDPRLLSGELHLQVKFIHDNFLKELYLKSLKIDNFPYYRKIKTDLDNQPLKNVLERIFSIYDISYNQFEALDFEDQYQFQIDLFEAIIPVIRKHFKTDAYGNEEMPNIEKVFFDLDCYRDNHYLHLYADNVLRKKFLENIPSGLSKTKILKMSPEELIDLDIQFNEK